MIDEDSSTLIKTLEDDSICVEAWARAFGKTENDTVVVNLYRNHLSVHFYLTPQEANDLASALVEQARTCVYE